MIEPVAPVGVPAGAGYVPAERATEPPLPGIYRVVGGAGLPKQCDYDSDDADYREEVRRVGVAADTLDDAAILFDGVPPDKISEFHDQRTPAVLLALHVSAAEKRKMPLAEQPALSRTTSSKEYALCGTASGRANLSRWASQPGTEIRCGSNSPCRRLGC